MAEGQVPGSFNLSPAGTGRVGLDGTSYEIELRSGFHSVIYHWWGSAPASWEALGRVFTQTVAELEQLRSDALRLGAAT